MPKEELYECEGIVKELLPGAKFSVEIKSGNVIVAHSSGRIRKNRIRILVGDTVTVEMTPYDLSKGRIIHRQK